MKLRIGQGMDAHRFVENRPLILGSIEIPYSKGLLGHSDADALIHAICDALLGALALGDIGQHFPDTDPQYKGKASSYFLQKVVQKVNQQKWNIVNVDTTVITEEPILKPYIHSMREALAKLMNLTLDQISIKATRPEKMGALGNQEGLVACAIVLIERQNE